MSNEKANTLSQIASKSLPKSLTKLYLCAIKPSNASVNEKNVAKITNKVIFLQIAAGMIKNGAATNLVAVKRLGLCGIFC